MCRLLGEHGKGGGEKSELDTVCRRIQATLRRCCLANISSSSKSISEEKVVVLVVLDIESGAEGAAAEAKQSASQSVSVSHCRS